MTDFMINMHKWKIAAVSAEEPNMEGMHGYTDYTNHMILIYDGLEETEMESTVIHEITHAYRWSYGFVSDVDNPKLTIAEIEEMIANFMENYGRQIVSISKELYLKLKKEIKNGKKL